MRAAERFGTVAIAALMAVAALTPGSADARKGHSARGTLTDAAIDVGYWAPHPPVIGRPMQGYDEPRPGPYRDAAQFWKNYQFYYDECRRPPRRPELDWDYVLSCYYGY